VKPANTLQRRQMLAASAAGLVLWAWGAGNAGPCPIGRCCGCQTAARRGCLERPQGHDRAQQQHVGNAACGVWHQCCHADQSLVCAQQPAGLDASILEQRDAWTVAFEGAGVLAPDLGRSQDPGRRDRGHRAAMFGQRSGLLPEQAQWHALARAPQAACCGVACHCVR
jgi:hypothetical protein